MKPRALIVGDRRKPGVEAGVARHLPFLERRLDVVGVDLEERVDLARASADLVLIFGGDGSFLAVARRLGTNPIPVLGVDYGRFGFLAEVEEDELEAGIEAYLAGLHAVSLRARLRCVLKGSGAPVESLALNDVVVGRASLGRMVEVDVRIDGREAIRYAGDGLIVATATGSTAHALAAGGPILDPALDAILLVPVCPHALGNRSLVVPGSSRIEMRANAGRSPAAVTVDGQVARELGPNDVVEVDVAAQAPLRVVRVSGRSFHDHLRTKLGWAGSPNYRSPGRASPTDAGPSRPSAKAPRPA